MAIQRALVYTIEGFENAYVTRPGYAVECDCFDPGALNYSLETLAIGGFYLAGQINGATGHEKSRRRGLLAGINAARVARPSRIACSSRGPSTACCFRDDDTDSRCPPTGRDLGLVDDARWSAFTAKREAVIVEQSRLAPITIKPQDLGEDRGQALLGDPLKEAPRPPICGSAPDWARGTRQPGHDRPGQHRRAVGAEAATAVGEQVESQTKRRLIPMTECMRPKTRSSRGALVR